VFGRGSARRGGNEVIGTSRWACSQEASSAQRKLSSGENFGKLAGAHFKACAVHQDRRITSR